LVTNLVDNAIRHNVTGGRVELSTMSTPGRTTITVGNTGPMISTGEIDRLFQPFQHLGSERVLHADGHGLGLAIVEAVAKAHGATVRGHPRPDGGLEIEVTFTS
jgi:signal transduction histidine kinase